MKGISFVVTPKCDLAFPRSLNTCQIVVWRCRRKYPHTSAAVSTTRADPKIYTHRRDQGSCNWARGSLEKAPESSCTRFEKFTHTGVISGFGHRLKTP